MEEEEEEEAVSSPISTRSAFEAPTPVAQNPFEALAWSGWYTNKAPAKEHLYINIDIDVNITLNWTFPNSILNALKYFFICNISSQKYRFQR